jgi:hypothetical protein
MSKAQQAIQAMIDGATNYLQSCMKDAINLCAYSDKIDKAIDRLENKDQIQLMVASNIMLVRVKVAKMDEVSPVIESLESELGIEFDKTEDRAEYGWRLFTCKDAPWIRVDAEIEPGSEECRKVIVAYETQQVPVYEIKCGEDAAQPDVELA